MEQITFPNGLRILMEEIPYVKTCAMGVWVGSGSRWETPETAGVSHFIEHMLFKGTETRTALDIAAEMDAIGGALNAYTSKEYTCVYARTLSEHTALALDIVSDMIAHPRMAAQDIETERSVILEELSMYEDSPEDLCSDLFYENVWQGDAIGGNILGTRARIQSLTETEMREHMRQYYVPERMVLSFCGNFDRDMVLSLCEERFGDLKNSGNPITCSVPAYHRFLLAQKRPFEQNRMILAYPGVAAQDDRHLTASLVCSLLGGSASSRLFQRLREELGLVYSVDAFSVPYLGAGLVGISMGLSKRSEKTALEETLQILKALPESITEQELARTKEQAVSMFIMGMESTAARAAHAAQGMLLKNRVESEEEIIAKVRAITREDAVDAARTLFQRERLSICCVGKVHEDSFYQKYWE